MFQQLRVPSLKKWALVLAIAAGSITFVQPGTAQAHCDSVSGPVVTAAGQALAENDVELILPYVQPGAEEELIAAFEHAQAVRALGPEAQELADHFFYETAVRLHRMGEGAAYTGLKTESDHGPALAAAEQALESGSLNGVYRVLNQAVRDEIAGKYAAVEDARGHAAKDSSVEAQRERVEAELQFETYVYGLYTAIVGDAGHGAEASAAHSH